MEAEFTRLLSGKDFRKLKRKVLEAVTDQRSFDELFRLVFHHERPLVIRAADAVEKLTVKHREYLVPHKGQLLSILKSADHKELKWHIAQLLPRIDLDKKELDDVWHVLTYWTLNRNESKIVRVNSLQGLFDLSRIFPTLQKDFYQTMSALERELIPSIKARIKKLKRLLKQNFT